MLTMPEIDHNFSQAHRIVTTSILPLVEQYAEHSRDVWDGAKVSYLPCFRSWASNSLQFWKQFFEASANVSLSGYEEHPNEDTTQEQTATDEESTANVTQSNATETTTSYDTPSSDRHGTPHRHEDLDMSSLSISEHSTPRPQLQHEKQADDSTTTASTLTDASPYETLRQQISESDSPFEIQNPSALPATPGRSPTHHHRFSPSPSPFIPPATHQKPASSSTPAKHDHHHKPSDPVMHRMLDKTYRVQATPLGKRFEGGRGRSKFNATPRSKAQHAPSSSSKYPFEDSPASSPEPEAPQLNAELFSSPAKRGLATPTPRRNRRPSSSHNQRTTPKPGVSVLTPAKGMGAGGAGKQPVWDSDDEFDDDDGEREGGAGPSPPKTMQFHVPQSRLMKTPGLLSSVVYYNGGFHFMLTVFV
jgi:DASH complex subunit ASK1